MDAGKAANLEARASQALVALKHDPRGAEAPLARPRPSAPFLAHLIGTAQNAPQSREKRRAEPAEAAAAYLKAGRSG